MLSTSLANTFKLWGWRGGGGGGGDIGTITFKLINSCTSLRSDLYLLILDCSDTNKVIVHTSEELSNLFIDGCFNEEGCIQ